MEKIYTGNIILTYEMGVRQKVFVRGTQDEINNKMWRAGYDGDLRGADGFCSVIKEAKLLFVEFEPCTLSELSEDKGEENL